MNQKLYLMKNEVGLYKIGISRKPEKRKIQLANTSGLAVELVSEWETEDARAVELFLHKHYENFRRKGEWFEFKYNPSQQIQNILSGGILEGCDTISPKEVNIPLPVEVGDVLTTIRTTPEIYNFDKELYWELISKVINYRMKKGCPIEFLIQYGYLLRKDEVTAAYMFSF